MPSIKIITELDELIDVIGKAQEDDGYLSTQITIRGLEPFSNRKYHELYNSGHLLTSACIHHRVTSCKQEDKPKDKPNILFIAIDDLRPELGCYGSDVAISPNLDKLADEGLLFSRAYCQQAICGPSRASLMTGARPETIGVTNNYVYFRDQNPDIVTLTQHFIANGYETVYCGKVFHGKMTDDEKSWSRKPAIDKVGFKSPKLPGGYVLPENQETIKKNKAVMIAKYGEQAKFGLGNGPAYECADVPDQVYSDGYNTDLAIATMKDMLKKGDKPFFLGLA